MKLISNVFKLFFYLILSVLLVHLFGLIGVFVAVSYPIWWLIVPKKTICFICRIVPQGQACPICHEVVADGLIYPKNFRSALINSMMLMAVSLLSIGLIVGESYLVSQLKTLGFRKTANFTINDRRNYKKFEIFPIKLNITGITQPINAVQADLAFDPQIVQLVDVSVEDSFATIFVQKEVDNENGYLRISGGLPNPGYSQEAGLFAVLYFQALSSGVSQIEFMPSSLVLANNGKGTNILKDYAKIPLFVSDKEASEFEQEAQNKLLLDSFILGSDSEDEQLLYFDQSISGQKIKEDLARQDTSFNNLIDGFVESVDRYNRFVIDFWTP